MRGIRTQPSVKVAVVRLLRPDNDIDGSELGRGSSSAAEECCGLLDQLKGCGSQRPTEQRVMYVSSMRSQLLLLFVKFLQGQLAVVFMRR
jgi:hypothetical protein